MAFENKLIHLFGDESTFKESETKYLTRPIKKIKCKTEQGRRRIEFYYDNEDVGFWYKTNLFADHSQEQEFEIFEGGQLVVMAASEAE